MNCSVLPRCLGVSVVRSLARRNPMFLVPALVTCLFLVTQPDPILEPGSRVEKVVTGCKFTEGPDVDAAGNLYFSDGPNDRIMKFSPDGKLTEFLKPCGR